MRELEKTYQIWWIPYHHLHHYQCAVLNQQTRTSDSFELKCLSSWQDYRMIYKNIGTRKKTFHLLVDQLVKIVNTEDTEMSNRPKALVLSHVQRTLKGSAAFPVILPRHSRRTSKCPDQPLIELSNTLCHLRSSEDCGTLRLCDSVPANVDAK